MNEPVHSSRQAGLRVSLVVGSMLRPDFLERLLGSLVVQRTPVHEVIIVEQRDISAAASIAERSALAQTSVVPSDAGLSRARNVGLSFVNGDVIGFPDDDCWYDPGTISRVVERFADDPKLGILCGRVMTSDGPMLRYPSRPVDVTRGNVWHTAVSPGIFVRASCAMKIGQFDEDLGVGSGSDAGSGEETDFVLRGIALGARSVYDPKLTVFHPSPAEVHQRLSPGVGFRYGVGMGVVLRQHGYGRIAAARAVLRPSVGGVVAALSGRTDLARFRFSVAKGRRRGLGWH
ncbi:MAG: glycosyltransferase [Micropruina sp.]